MRRNPKEIRKGAGCDDCGLEVGSQDRQPPRSLSWEIDMEIHMEDCDESGESEETED